MGSILLFHADVARIAVAHNVLQLVCVIDVRRRKRAQVLLSSRDKSTFLADIDSTLYAGQSARLVALGSVDADLDLFIAAAALVHGVATAIGLAGLQTGPVTQRIAHEVIKDFGRPNDNCVKVATYKTNMVQITGAEPVRSGFEDSIL